MGDFDFKSTGFTVSGFKELYKTIEHLGQAVLSHELSPMLEECLEPVRDTARALAPDDPLTGPPYNLPTSIEISTRQRSGRAKSDRALGQYDARAYMGPTKFGYPEAIFAEFGTTQRYWEEPGPIKYTGLMRAVPYMRPAWDSMKQYSLQILKIRFASHVMAVARKYAYRG